MKKAITAHAGVLREAAFWEALWRVRFCALLCVLLLAGCQKDMVDEGSETRKGDSQRGLPGISEGFECRIGTGDAWNWRTASKIPVVEANIDQMVAAGANMVRIATYDFMPIFFVDYTNSPYPLAAQVPSSIIVSNLATMNHNIAYAHSKGLRVFSASHCHYCPYSLWRGYQKQLNPEGLFTDAWMLSAHQSNQFQSSMNGDQYGIVPHQLWSNQFYKDFFVWSTKAMLDVLPGLDGWVNSYSEVAWEYNMDMLRAGVREADCRDRNLTNDQFVDYMNTMYDVLLDKRGPGNFIFGINDWYTDLEQLARTRVPHDQIQISVKYAGSDSPLVNYPIWANPVRDQGYRVTFAMQLYDSEYPRAVYWYDNAMINKMIANVRNGGFAGITAPDFQEASDAMTPLRTLFQRTVAAAWMGSSFERSDALNFLLPIYGRGAEDVLRAWECDAVAFADVIKLNPVWFWQGDGMTSGGLSYCTLWKMADRPDLPAGSLDFVRQDAVGLPEYSREAIAGGGSPSAVALARWKAEGRRTPPEVFQEMEDKAQEAVDAFVRARNAGGYGANFGDYFASAVVGRELIRRDLAFMRGALDYLIMGATFDGLNNGSSAGPYTGIDRRADMYTQWTEYIRRDRTLEELCNRLPIRTGTYTDSNYSIVTKSANNYGVSITIPATDQVEVDALIKLIKIH